MAQEYKFDNKLSAKGKLWSLRECDENKALAIKQKFNVSDILARLLAIKDIEIEDIEDFLNPRIRNLLPDPNHLKDMEKAVDRIFSAIKNDENIVIYGDYDVDGATSSAILRRFFDSLEVNNKTYIPDRISEGYGLNTNALTELKQKGADLVITVDCGIVSFEPIAKAKEQGLDVVVIDHHLSTENLPEAFAVVNPNRFDENNELTNLCAAGVVFLLVISLNRKLRDAGFYKDKSEPNIMEYLDLVALGTVCDVMTLTGLNRAYVNQGLKVMSAQRNTGLNALAEIAELDRKPDVYSLGFIFGPRINAGGRVGNCRLGSDLLSTNCPDTAKEIASALDKLNTERQEIEKQTLEEAYNQAESLSKESPFIMVSNKGWHPGVIGIVAGRLKETYNKPAAVIAFDGSLGKASARSVEKVDIGRAIANAKIKGFLVDGGGHKAAGGFTVEESKLKEFYDFVCNQISDEYLVYSNDNSIKADLCVNLSSLNVGFFEELQKLGPFGNGNPEPRIIIENVKMSNQKIYSDKHICYFMNDASAMGNIGGSVKAISFNVMGTELGDSLLSANGRSASVFGKLKKNEWNGQENIEFIIDDIIV